MTAGTLALTGRMVGRLTGPRLRAGSSTRQPSLAWCTNRSDLPTSTKPISATLIHCVTRVSFWTGGQAIKNPRFGWVNWLLTADGAETNGTLTPYTLTRHSIEWSGQPKLTNDDNQVVAVGDTYEGAPFDVTIPANTQYWVTAQFVLQASGVRPVQYYFEATRGEGAHYTANLTLANNQFTGAFTTNSTLNGIGPAYGYGEAVGGAVPSIAIIGDSIGSFGTGDNALGDSVGGARSGGDAAFNRGYLRRAVHGLLGYPILGLGCAGHTVDTGYGSSFSKRAAILAKASTHIISQLGQNNVGDGEATLKTKVDAMLADYETLGLPIVQCGLCPQSTSTDGWSTLENQTARNVTLRDNMTSYYQAKVGSQLLAVLTPFAFLSPSAGGDYGKWALVGGAAATGDGINPNHLAAAAAATGVAAQITF